MSLSLKLHKNPERLDYEGYLGVPSRLRNLIKKLESPKLSVLISNRIMQSMSTNVPEEAIQSNLLASGLGTSDFEDTSSHSQPSVGGDNLCASDPFGKLTTFTSCQSCASC